MAGGISRYVCNTLSATESEVAINKGEFDQENSDSSSGNRDAQNKCNENNLGMGSQVASEGRNNSRENRKEEDYTTEEK